MIVVKVEIWPHGQPPGSHHARLLGYDEPVAVLAIVNNESGTHDYGNYHVYDHVPAMRFEEPQGAVLKHPRFGPEWKKNRNVLSLLHRALDALGVETPEPA